VNLGPQFCIFNIHTNPTGLLTPSTHSLQYLGKCYTSSHKFNLTFSAGGIYEMAFKGNCHMRSKININDKSNAQPRHLNYLEYDVSIFVNENLELKLNKFNHMCKKIGKQKIHR
jgi:hypothetical protein